MSATAAPPGGAKAPPPPALPRLILYGACSFTLGMTQGLGNNLVAGNLQAAQAAFGATTTEVAWLGAAYTATSVTASLLLFKFRTQFGLRRFAELGLLLFAAVCFAHLFVEDLRSAVLLRGVAGFVAAPLNTLAFLYMLEPLPAEKKLTVGVPLGLIGSQVAVPLARIVSPTLLEFGLWQQLLLLEMGCALLSLAVVLVVPVTPPPRARVLDRVDAISMPLVALGLGLLSVVLTLGRTEWWFEAPWLGLCLAASIAALTLLVVIELNRARPLIDLHWLSSRDMILFAGSMFFGRFVLTEQSIGAIGFFQNLGLLNEHMRGLMGVILAATLLGFVSVAFFNRPENLPRIHGVALGLIAAGALLESQATSLTRPQDVWAAQGLVALGGALFLPSAVAWSFGHTLRAGTQYLTSFFAVFLASQNLGGALGAAALGTLVTVREKFHSSQLVENLLLTDPLVAARIARSGAALAPVLGDPVLRRAEGTALLGQAAAREAYALAYNDLFLVVAGVSVLLLLALFLHQIAVRRPARAGGGA